MTARNRLNLKKEILAALTPDQLEQINAGIAATNGGLCADLTLDPAAGCVTPTCGPKCTARSQLTDVRD